MVIGGGGGWCIIIIIIISSSSSSSSSSRLPHAMHQHQHASCNHASCMPPTPTPLKPTQVNAREAKKLQDKERLIMEKAHRMREEAMREDDNVFDVAFEGMGNEDATVSATDIKVHSLTVRAKGKLLLENTSLTIAAGECGPRVGGRMRFEAAAVCLC
jgi:hypothetical protein